VHDYGEMVEVDADVVEETLADAQCFVIAVEEYLRGQGLL
jgi:hypothetical protein